MSVRMHARSSPLNAPRRAFTLVELLVVIGIIAVLIGVLLPALGRARESANQVKCMANMRSIGQALVTYAQYNKGSLPYGQYLKNDRIWVNDVEQPPYTGEGADWTTLLVSILAKGQGIGFGTGGTDTGQAAVDQNYARTRAVFLCPAVFIPTNVPSQALTHYSSHPRIMPNLVDVDILRGIPRNGLKPYKISNIKRASEIAIIFEGATANTGVTAGYMAHSTCNLLDDSRIPNRSPYLTDLYYKRAGYEGGQPINLTGAAGWTYAADCNKDTFPNRGNIRFRHMKDTQTNTLMADGHVQSFKFNKSSKDAANATDLLRKYVCVNP